MQLRPIIRNNWDSNGVMDMVDRTPDNRIFASVVEASAKELSHIMEVSATERAKDLVKRAIGRPAHVQDPMLMLGLAKARKVIEADGRASKTESDSKTDKALLDCIDGAFSGHVELWNRQYGSKISFVDDALAGAALIEMYEQTSDEIYKEAAQKIYEFVSSAPRDEAGSIIYNASKGNRNIFADGVGQTAMFLSIYGRNFDVPEALELARVQLSNFKKYGMDERSGLCYHGYELTDGVPMKKGILGWGRAMGWLMMGLSAYADKADDQGLRDWYLELSENTASYTRQDGGYSWQIQAVDGHFDSSATGMLAYSLLAGGAADDDSSSCRAAVEGSLKALEAVTDPDGLVGSALSACEDFGVHYQNYGHFSWGQGAALAAASLALSR